MGIGRPVMYAFVESKLLPVTAGVQRIAYHIKPTSVMVNLARCAVMLFRLVLKDFRTCKALPTYGLPLCGMWQLGAKDFGEVLTTQDIYNYFRQCLSALFCRRRIVRFHVDSRFSPKSRVRPTQFASNRGNSEHRHSSASRNAHFSSSEALCDPRKYPLHSRSRKVNNMHSCLVICDCTQTLCGSHAKGHPEFNAVQAGALFGPGRQIRENQPSQTDYLSALKLLQFPQALRDTV
ncbi:hypothetical protein CLF_111009 [Clonorchis sinensis]|uniref:Uncharacterized protein n=1 Tax=Clonorchis sinensis TaxID=79923 RepID=G7YU69_CLOSI|nr:hypothetical protein CLF_111009 [Clonorchis sinensis]